MIATLPSARALGAPGVYALPDANVFALSAQRMDVCAFVGVAPRGPAHRAVLVRSFDEYRATFGGLEGPGFLPHAVAAFFQQGGRRAYVVRVVAAPDPANDAIARARIVVAEPAASAGGDLFTVPLELAARDEGKWGDALRVEARFTLAPVTFELAGTALRQARATLVPPGALLLLEGDHGARQYAWCLGAREIRDPMGPSSKWELVLDPLAAYPALRAHVVEMRLTVRDDMGSTESLEHVGLHPRHAYYLPAALESDSMRVRVADAASLAELLPSTLVPERLRGATLTFHGGDDRYGAIVPWDFFDDDWSPAEEGAGRGIAAIADRADVTHLAVPDLYMPLPWVRDPPFVEEAPAGEEFSACVDIPEPIRAAAAAPSDLTGLILDPPTDLADIMALHERVVAFCEDTHEVIALLDVPPGLSQGQAERWRARFDSSWAAAYHPWLRPSRSAAQDNDAGPRVLPPSAVAAGIIARKELRRGIQFGPANEIAEAVIDLAEAVPADRADAFHPQGMNCFVRETDGIHLVSARTLSRDPQWRQLSVRRLVLMICRTLRRETQWAVFEPNGPTLWRDLSHAIDNLLRQLFRAGAFAGATESESYFVRVRDDRQLLDAGELVIEIGLAPAEPLEFVLVRLRRAGDGTLTLEA
jgi:hypothetical protein